MADAIKPGRRRAKRKTCVAGYPTNLDQEAKMGLDITAYRKIKLVCVQDGDAWEEAWTPDTCTVHLWPGYVNEPQFQEQIAGADLVPDGTYEYEEEFGFRAGSYSGYNDWRNKLALEMLGVSAEEVWANSEVYRDRQFFLLINFSDCEGFIAGPSAERLAQEFAKYQEVADRHLEGWYLEQYNNWRKAFELAADNGLVDFH
jgi:hypothetical protein